MPSDQFGRVIRSAPAPQLNIPTRPVRNSYFDIHDAAISNAIRDACRPLSRPWYRRLWEGFDNAITEIGNLFARRGEDFANITVGICIWVLALGLVWWVIQHWIDDGFLWAVLYAFGAMIIFGAGSFCLGIISFVLQLAIAALRFVFWNAWSFLAVVLLLFGPLLFNACVSSVNNSSQTSDVEAITLYQATTFRCTAKVLNVRSGPNTYSTVYGVLYRGQLIEVTDTANGFAHIDFNGRDGYVSTRYLDEVK